jgi:hypothetical protein
MGIIVCINGRTFFGTFIVLDFFGRLVKSDVFISEGKREVY